MNLLKFLFAFVILALVQSLCGGATMPAATTPPDASPIPSSAPMSIGIVTKVQTNVQAGPATALEQVASSRNLLNDDAIHVTNGGVATVEFGNSISIQLFNDSAVGGVSATISPGTPNRIRMKLERGGLSGKVVKTGGGLNIEIANGATITILGTQFFVTYDPVTGDLSAGNFDGVVGYTLPGQTTASLPSGTIMDVASNGSVEFGPLPFDRVAFDAAAKSANSPLIGLENLLKQNTKPTDTPEPMTTLTIWSILNDRYTGPIESAFKSYQARHPEIAVNFVQIPQAQFLDWLKTALAVGEGPDIVLADHTLIGTLAENKLIISLDSLGVNSDELFGQFEPAPAQAMLWNDSIWGLPVAEEGIALIANRDLMTKIYTPESQWDWDNFREMAKLYSSRHDEDFLFCNPGLGLKAAQPSYYVAPILLGADYPDNLKVPGYIDNNGGIYLTYPSTLTGGNLISSLRDGLTWSNVDYRTCQTLFNEKRTAAFWTGPWELSNLTATGFDLGVVPMGRPFIIAKTAMLTPAASQRGTDMLALELMRYLAGSESALELAGTGLIVPANSTALKLLKKGLIFEFGNALHEGVAETNAPFADKQWEPIDNAIRSIWDGANPEDALNQAQQKIILP